MLQNPIEVDVVEAVPKKPEIGSLFKADGKKVINAISQLTESQINEIEKALNESK